MGMAASQARLIALTARMNDVEYQGQQINQQRTTLSNQVNALYNQLLEMSVPTPPSTKDYTKIEYSGKYNASSFTIKSVYPTGDNKYTLNLDYKQAGNIMEKSSYGSKVVYQPDVISVSAVSENDLEDFNALLVKSTDSRKIIGSYETYSAEDDDEDILIKVGKDDIPPDAIEVYYKGKDASGKDVYRAYDKNNPPDDCDGEVYVYCNVSNLNVIDDPYAKIAKKAPSTGKYTNVYLASEQVPIKVANGNLGADAKKAIIAKNYYIMEDGGVRKIKAEDLDTEAEVQALLTPNKIYKADANSTTTCTNLDKKDGSEYQVSGYKSNGDYYEYSAYALNNPEIVSMLGIDDSQYEKLIESLKHTTDLSEDEIKNKYIAYFDEKDSLVKCIDRDDISTISGSGSVNGVRSWYTSTGTYSETKEYNDCELEFDNNGRITMVTLTDDNGTTHTVKVSAEEVTDQEALNEAYQQYEYDKYLYDKKQQEINARTSIIQREDKNLELKLTRLDNERNALKTEIDAVKEVVKNNIEKSFKTFSG